MRVDDELQVLIVGGGLGGLATAKALGEAGLDPVVVERDEGAPGTAMPVELWPGAMAVLSAYDLDHRVRSVGTPVRAWSLETPVSSVEYRRTDEVPSDVVVVEYDRLLDVVATSLPSDAVRKGRAVRSIEEDADTVSVTFENGLTERFDAVVGADGIRSTIRSEILGTETLFSYKTTSVVFPLVRAPEYDGGYDLWTTGGAVFRVLPTADRYWGWLTVPLRTWNRTPDPVDVVVEHTVGTDVVPTDAVPHTPESYFVTHDRQVKPIELASTRAVLVGDAAHTRHPLSGGGPIVALGDAAQLAASLARSRASLPDRFAAYATRRGFRTGYFGATDGTYPSFDGVERSLPRTVRRAAEIRQRRLVSSFSGTGPILSIDCPSPRSQSPE